MTLKQEARIKKIGIFNLKQAAKVGIDQPNISRLVKTGLINRVGRGLYIHAMASVSKEVGFQIACVKFGPDSAIGGLSALFHYNLIEQVPVQTWILVPLGKLSRDKAFRLMRTKSSLTVGIVAEDRYRIVSVERAVLEALKFSSKIGERTALSAARTAIANRQTSEAKLGKVAKDLGLTPTLTKYFEAITA